MAQVARDQLQLTQPNSAAQVARSFSSNAWRPLQPPHLHAPHASSRSERKHKSAAQLNTPIIDKPEIFDLVQFRDAARCVQWSRKGILEPFLRLMALPMREWAETPTKSPLLATVTPKRVLRMNVEDSDQETCCIKLVLNDGNEQVLVFESKTVNGTRQAAASQGKRFVSWVRKINGEVECQNQQRTGSLQNVTTLPPGSKRKDLHSAAYRDGSSLHYSKSQRPGHALQAAPRPLNKRKIEFDEIHYNGRSQDKNKDCKCKEGSRTQSNTSRGECQVHPGLYNADHGAVKQRQNPQHDDLGECSHDQILPQTSNATTSSKNSGTSTQSARRISLPEEAAVEEKLNSCQLQMLQQKSGAVHTAKQIVRPDPKIGSATPKCLQTQVEKEQHRSISPTPATVSTTEWAKIEAEYWSETLAARRSQDQDMDEKYDQMTASLKTRHTGSGLELVQLNRINLKIREAKEIVASRRKLQDNETVRVFEHYKKMALHRETSL